MVPTAVKADTVVAASGHNLTKVAAADPSCEKAGSIEYWVCETCKKLFGDAEGNKEIAEKDTVAAALGHKLQKVSAVSADCEHAGIVEHWKCTVCGELFADEAGTKELSDEELEIPLQKHSYSEPEYKWSSDNREVIATAVCTECDEEVEETVRTRASIKKKATCVSKGITVYTASFKSEAFSTQTKELENRVVDPYAHSWDAGRVTLKANASRTGKKEYKCTVCF